MCTAMCTAMCVKALSGCIEFKLCHIELWGPLMVAQWLRYCATNRKVAGSIPDGVIGIFH
jgi:hypothetical protein